MILSWILLILSLLGYLALIILHLKKRGSAKLDAAVYFAQAALWLAILLNEWAQGGSTHAFMYAVYGVIIALCATNGASALRRGKSEK